MRFRRYYKRCSYCDTKLVFRAEDDVGSIGFVIAGDYCTKCNQYEFSYAMDKLVFDKTKYLLKVLEPNKLTLEQKKKLSELKKVKKKSSNGKEVFYKGKAKKIDSILTDLQSHNITYEITPSFPYPIITECKESSSNLSKESLDMWYDKNRYEIEILPCETIDFEQIVFLLDQYMDEYSIQDNMIIKAGALKISLAIYRLEYEQVKYHLLFDNPYPGLLEGTIEAANGNRCIREKISHPDYNIPFMYHKA